ncbi:hypothetical protein [Paramaledivibacter caminithermalis]|nr:hypothetical protein [Paramaledivibacter caminithermalis]
MKDNCNEIIKSIIPKFFEVSFYNLKYYDLIITNKRLIFVWMGESYKNWMLRTEIGMNKRKDIVSCDINRILINEKNIVLDFEDIEAIKFHKRTFLKNVKLYIKTIGREYRFYSRDTKADLRESIKSLEKSLFNDKSYLQDLKGGN